MSYSYKFCKQRIKSKDLYGFEDVDFSKAAEYDIRSTIRADFLEKRKYDTIYGAPRNIETASISFDKNDKTLRPEYFPDEEV